MAQDGVGGGPALGGHAQHTPARGDARLEEARQQAGTGGVGVDQQRPTTRHRLGPRPQQREARRRHTGGAGCRAQGHEAHGRSPWDSSTRANRPVAARAASAGPSASGTTTSITETPFRSGAPSRTTVAANDSGAVLGGSAAAAGVSTTRILSPAVRPDAGSRSALTGSGTRTSSGPGGADDVTCPG